MSHANAYNQERSCIRPGLWMVQGRYVYSKEGHWGVWTYKVNEDRSHSLVTKVFTGDTLRECLEWIWEEDHQ